MQYYFNAGPEYRVFRRAKASGTFHALFGNAWGIFDAANLNGLDVQTIGLFQPSGHSAAPSAAHSTTTTARGLLFVRSRIC